MEPNTARVHANRLKEIGEGLKIDTRRLEHGLWPDLPMVIRRILGNWQTERGVEYQVKRKGWNGFKLVP